MKCMWRKILFLTSTLVILLHSHMIIAKSFFSMHTNTCRNTDWLHWHGGHKYTLGSLWVKPGGEQPEQTIPLATSADGLRTFHLPFISICIIPMHSVTGGELYPIQWEAVGRLELMGFHVLGVTCDGLAANRKLIRLHSTATGVVYKTENPYAPDKRPLFFISDPPHLMKTVRNAWEKRDLWVSSSVWFCCQHNKVKLIFTVWRLWDNLEPFVGDLP